MAHSALPITHHSSVPNQIVQTSNAVSDQYIDSLMKFTDYYNLFLKQYCFSPELCMNDFKTDDKQVVFKSEKIITGKQADLIRALATIFLFKSIAPSLNPSSKNSSRHQKSKPKIPNRAIREKSLKKEDSPSNLDLAHIDLMPAELLALILQQIPETWLDVSKLALTSKRFYQITRTSSFLRRIFQNRPSIFSEISRPQLQLQLMKISHFQPEFLECTQPDLTDRDLTIIAENGSNLTHLKFQNTHFTPEGFIHLLNQCKKLRSIEFHNCQDPQLDKWIVAVSLYAPCLERLAIIDCPITDSSLFALAAFGPKLHSFEYRDRLSQGKLTDYGMIPFLTNLYQLESFFIEGCPQITQIPLILYTQLKGMDTYTTRGNHLKHLGFSFCGMIDERLYETLADECPNLQSLYLGFASSQCGTNTDIKREGLKNLFKFCDQLSSIRFRNCSYLSEELISKLFKYNSNIDLELYDCIPLTPALTQCIQEQKKRVKVLF